MRESVTHARIRKMWVFRFCKTKSPLIITVQEKGHARTYWEAARSFCFCMAKLSFVITVCGNVAHAHILYVYFLRLFFMFIYYACAYSVRLFPTFIFCVYSVTSLYHYLFSMYLSPVLV